MSLSKELCLRSDLQNSDSISDYVLQSTEDNYRRDSFVDRFCDDLCEDLLQFLSFEDKLRLEGVSKQFQRTVFGRHYELFINVVNPEYYKYLLKNEYSVIRRNYYYIKNQSMHTFKALLKKCPNITSIDLDGDLYDIKEVFQSIVENCNNLSQINVRNYIDFSNFGKYQQKLVQKIKYLRYFIQFIDLNSFPNIERLEITYVENESIIPLLKLDKLQKLEISIDKGKEHLLEIVIDTFPTLTHLSADVNSEDENAFYNSLKNISNLKHLIHFKLYIQFGKNNKRFCDLLKQMANNCKNLKSIDFGFNIDQNLDVRQLLSQFKAFPALKRLTLNVNNQDKLYIDVNQMFSFELFKDLSDITHLTLTSRGLNCGKTLKESILKEIDINLPKLQYLEIENRFDTTPEGVTQMADILSRLSSLETLKLRFKPDFKLDLKRIEEQITEKCEKIRKIQLLRVW